MLKIRNTDKLVGETFSVEMNLWRVEGVYNYGPDGHYQIQLRTNGNEDDKVFILSKEKGNFVVSAKYKITDAFEPFSSVWVTEANIGSVTSMLRTLKRIISHANTN